MDGLLKKTFPDKKLYIKTYSPIRSKPLLEEKNLTPGKAPSLPSFSGQV
jgi:hypothetical protein